MNFYRASADDNHYSWHGTLADAHKAAKVWPQCFRHDVLIELFDIPADKEGVLDLLRGDKPMTTVLRTWMLTHRGGLKEITQ